MDNADNAQSWTQSLNRISVNSKNAGDTDFVALIPSAVLWRNDQKSQQYGAVNQRLFFELE